MTTQQMTQQIAEYFKTQPVLKAWLFGSFARGEQREDSDVDIMIIPDSGVGLFKLSGMCLDLQALLQVPVDLVTEKGLLPFARSSVENDRILIYESSVKTRCV
jgi:predicted nucleotidyltransferase